LSNIILHGMWRSSASYRVRIALNLKGLTYEQKNYALAKGEHKTEEFLSKNPQGLIPALEVDGKIITQSLAIMEYLDHIAPDYRLLPKDPFERARVQSIAYAIACEVHPLLNLRVLQYLKNDLDQDQDGVNTWYHHWIKQEFTALEKKLSSEQETGIFCHGDTPDFADCLLVPQVYNANRFKCDLSDYPTILRINEECLRLKAFEDAVPENQPDAI
jgi:maleylacetoacetate isomerase